MQKVMQTVVLYGEAPNAERLVDIEVDGHFVISWANSGIAPSLKMLDEFLEVVKDGNRIVIQADGTVTIRLTTNNENGAAS
jgi:hypothetical protein